MFFTLCRTKIFIRSSFDLSSANAFNFNQPENSWFGYKVKRLNSLSNHKTLDQSKLEAFADDKINIIQRFKLVFGRLKIFGKEEKKCRLPAVSPFPTMFSTLPIPNFNFLSRIYLVFCRLQMLSKFVIC